MIHATDSDRRPSGHVGIPQWADLHPVGSEVVTSNIPAPNELPNLLTNVSYEVEVLAWSLHRAGELEHDAEVLRKYQVAIDRSAYVNAALVSARNLVYFFANSRWRQGAVIAKDFIADWPSTAGEPIVDVVNQQVVHIGLERVRSPRPVNFTGITDSIDSCLGEFATRLEPPLQSKAHRSLAAALEAVVAPGKRR